MKIGGGFKNIWLFVVLSIICPGPSPLNGPKWTYSQKKFTTLFLFWIEFCKFEMYFTLEQFQNYVYSFCTFIQPNQHALCKIVWEICLLCSWTNSTFCWRMGRVREDINGKKRFLLGIARMREGGLPMPEFFGPFSRSAFLVSKKSLFLQKCQCIELLTVF